MDPWREKGVPSFLFCRKSWDWSLNGSRGGTKTQKAVVSGVPQIKKIKEPTEGSQATPTPTRFPLPIGLMLLLKGHLSPWKPREWGREAGPSWCHFKVTWAADPGG